MFFFTYLPQLAIMAFVNGPLAVLTTALLILNESATITSMVSKNFLLQEAILDTFDGTLVARNSAGIVAEGREVKAGGDAIQRLGKVLKNPFKRFSINEVVRYFMYLPLNFVPGMCESHRNTRPSTWMPIALTRWYSRGHRGFYPATR
jgi:hypothetical protein